MHSRVPCPHNINLCNVQHDISAISVIFVLFFSAANMKDDIGWFITASMSASEVEATITGMSPQQKYHLLKHHFEPPSSYVFPSSKEGGCYRQFKSEWFNLHPWIKYSQKLDAAFCVQCALFVAKDKRKLLGALVNQPFTKWHKKSEKIVPHATKIYHIEAQQAADTLINSIEHPNQAVHVMVNNWKAENIERNRHIVKCVAEAVLYCGRQCIALRGDNENLSTSGNPGNFLAMLQTIANHDQILKAHLDLPKLKNATYLSPQTQNEVADIIAIHMIQKPIIQEIIKSQYFAIMADEVSSHNTEQLPLCIRYVDDNADIREEFIQFAKLTVLSGNLIAQEIMNCLRKLDLDIEKCRGQSYDGASNMSSSKRGVREYIRQMSPRAVYVHCHSHRLNLVIFHSCSHPAIKYMGDKLKSVYIFFDYPKRAGLLQAIADKDGPVGSKRKPLTDMCRTRWAERHDANSGFYTSYVYIVKALEVIAEHAHQDEYDNHYVQSDWCPKTRSEAGGLLRAITTFDFIVTFLTMYNLLSHLEGITIKLQRTNLDVLEAYNMVSSNNLQI